MQGPPHLPPIDPSPQTLTHAPHDQPVRLDTKPRENRTMAQRALVHISRSEQRVIDPDDVYCIVATGGETEVRLCGRAPLIDIRPLGELLPSLERLSFVRIRHQDAVNPAHVRRTTTELRTWKTYKEKESTGMAYRCLPRWLDLECPPVLEPCTRV
jgi:DNA-binding LytR/AlgR family response regulator